MIIEDIHVNSLRSAMCESSLVILLIDKLPNACQDHCARENGLKITPRHLQDKTKGGGHCRDKTGSTLNTSAPFVFFWVIWWDLEIFLQISFNNY